nr:callose synthase 5 [Tanacetum cinerariifolium]GFA19660.1 callose synthase 5 [Tanacetum cinerariifolium]
DSYLEEAFKMRNLLEEFHEDHRVRPPMILGMREHIFTRSVSSLAWFMSNRETSFVNIGQRVLARPLKKLYIKGVEDNYLKQAFKMRNVLEEFLEDHGVRLPTIL